MSSDSMTEDQQRDLSLVESWLDALRGVPLPPFLRMAAMAVAHSDRSGRGQADTHPEHLQRLSYLPASFCAWTVQELRRMGYLGPARSDAPNTCGLVVPEVPGEVLITRDAWRTLVLLSDLTTPAKLVAVVYAEDADNTTDVQVHGEALRERSSLSRDASNRALRLLEARGWLVVTQRAAQHRSTCYALHVPMSTWPEVS